jgi:hypothetical protein
MLHSNNEGGSAMPNVLELLALTVLVGGLAAIVLEIWLKDRTVLVDLRRGLRHFAEPERPASTARFLSQQKPEVAANTNEFRKAA